MTFYVVIRGPLGVGKSTVSRLLARQIGADHVEIDRILEEHGLEEWDEDCISLRSFLRANAVAIDSARSSMVQGRPVVFDGNFYWKEAIDDLTRQLTEPHVVFTLEAPLAECIRRDGRRPSAPAGREAHAGDRLGAQATTEVFRLVTQFRYGRSIDATGSTTETVRAIVRELSDAGFGPLTSPPRALRARGHRRGGRRSNVARRFGSSSRSNRRGTSSPPD